MSSREQVIEVLKDVLRSIEDHTYFGDINVEHNHDDHGMPISSKVTIFIPPTKSLD